MHDEEMKDTLLSVLRLSKMSCEVLMKARPDISVFPNAQMLTIGRKPRKLDTYFFLIFVV